MGDDLLPELGDLVFSVLIGYAGALQFLYVVRHLYHWSCGHMARTENDAESLKRLQERMRNELAEAEAKELQAGTQVMKDGLLYKDGFRTDAEQLKNDRLRAEQSTPEAREKRKKEIESELKRQKEIEEKTRAQLAEAEAQLEQQRKQAAEELAARQQAEEERAKEAEREEARKLLEREQMRVEEERRREVEEEARRKRDAEEEARRVAEEEAARKRAEEEEIKRQEQEAARKAAEEEAKQKRAAEEEEERRLEEQARKAAEEEELAQKLAEEAEAQRRREVEALRAAEANAAREAEEQSQKLLEAERQRELEQRKREAEEEAGTTQMVAEGNAAKEAEEQSQKLLEAERQHELEQREREAEEEAIKGHIENWTGTNNRDEEEDAENERKLFETEQLHEEEQRAYEMEEAQNEGESESAPDDEEEEEEIKFNRMFANEALASKKQNELGEAEALDSIMQLLDAESDRQMREKEFEEAAARERGEKQRVIEENARKFLEADQEMEQLLESVQKQRRLSATESAPQSPVFEEPCIRKTMSPLSDNSDSGGVERVTQTVKTQFGQTSNEPYSLTTKPLLFKSISDDAPSLEPHSSLSAQPSDEFETDAYETLHNTIDVQFTQLERQAPDGEDNDNTSPTQYTDDYLRSLDGIKQRPLVREDGSGRRRAFKKRRSSGSSNSSFESRASREEELKMFTSLEEEELKATKEGETDFTPIKYSNDQLLKVKPPRRRHKRSPAKDAKPSDRSLRGSLEMLNEEANTNPWGEVAPEHYKDMPFWKHEKSMSIDEETIESELPAAGKEEERDVNARNLPTASAFEEATNTQNEEAITVLQRQKTKEEQETVDDQQQPVSDEPARSDIQPNLIFSGEYTKAMDKDWHSGHFCCWQCDESLTGQRYVIRDDHPYCIKCYENVFANTCEECNKIIGIDSKDLSYKDKHWHEACFLCFKCHLSLVDKQFGAKADKIYCGTCYDAQFASRCDGCGEVFRAGTKKMEYKTRQWHENCFCCCVCKMAIGTKSFIPREQEIYCAGCYEEKFATRCIKCNKVITSGGVTYKNEPWHRECFTCTHCNITLAGQRFTSRDEKPYCAECFGELFAKRCTACEKPITGIGGTRFISFEDRHWHHDCFVCASCKTSLVGRGFITDGPDIICPECAKQRLM
ncbi:trichohyalin isoform X1 [Anastrepha obliqua]|uniref:trichohyalin isoform X1 n=1 Tax=Anastrepha obliqua TaxID=95512 RepID=UPI002409B79E|nr:trichohyalin isoform X1 [Anastrepha obliqua]